jgi:hypothetical protein
LEEEGKKSKKFTDSCKELNLHLPLHSQFRKEGRNRKDSETNTEVTWLKNHKEKPGSDAEEFFKRSLNG